MEVDCSLSVCGRSGCDGTDVWSACVALPTLRELAKE